MHGINRGWSQQYINRILWQAFLIFALTSIATVFLNGSGGIISGLLALNALSPIYTVGLALFIEAIVYTLAFVVVIRTQIRISVLLFIFVAIIVAITGGVGIITYNYIFGVGFYFSPASYALSYMAILFVLLIVEPQNKVRISASKPLLRYLYENLTTIEGTDLLILLSIAAFLLIIYYYNYLSPQAFAGQGINYTGRITVTTINTIKAGRYPTALDKFGTGGVLIELTAVQVLGITREPDGDVHINIASATNQTLISEFTPLSYLYFNQSIKAIGVNSAVNIVGTPYCDVTHSTESWHGYSCWELHPVTFIQSNSVPVSINATFIPEPALEP